MERYLSVVPRQGLQLPLEVKYWTRQQLEVSGSKWAPNMNRLRWESQRQVRHERWRSAAQELLDAR